MGRSQTLGALLEPCGGDRQLGHGGADLSFDGGHGDLLPGSRVGQLRGGPGKGGLPGAGHGDQPVDFYPASSLLLSRGRGH